MPLMPSAVLEDPRYRVPAAPPADAGLAWLRSQVPRSCDGPEHARRRAAVDDVVSVLTVIPDPAADPAVVLLQALGLPTACLDDVALAAAAYRPHTPQSAGADAALERLVAGCGGCSEGTAARVCLLVPAPAAMEALVGRGPHACPGRAIAEAWAEVLG